MTNDALRVYAAEYDEPKTTVYLSPFSDKTKRYALAYARLDPEHLTLDGAIANNHLSMRLRKIDTNTFLLLNRGFHWINEQPLNR
jgi:hypothetical protein